MPTKSSVPFVSLPILPISMPRPNDLSAPERSIGEKPPPTSCLPRPPRRPESAPDDERRVVHQEIGVRDAAVRDLDVADRRDDAAVRVRLRVLAGLEVHRDA